MSEINIDRKNLIPLVHIGGILFSILPSVLALVLMKELTVEETQQLKVALNFQITLLAFSIVLSLASSIPVIGLVIAPISFLAFLGIFIANIVLCIQAAQETSKGNAGYKFPFSFIFVK